MKADNTSASTTGVPPSGLAHGMRAFRHQSFKRFWLGALVSNSGTWLQNLTIPYVLLEITNEASWVGLAAFATLFPVMILGPIAGNFADRFDRRGVLMVGQTAAALAAGLLYFAYRSGVRDPGAIVALAALSGVIGGFTLPTWQSFIPTLVPNEDLASAISLNSLQFNVSRALGPAVGGALIAVVGPGAAFGINALSFGAVLIALFFIKATTTTATRQRHPIIKGFVESIHYVRGQPGIMSAIGIASVVAFLGYPIVSFVVVFAKQVYEVEPWALGVLTALLGTGSILAVPIVSGVFGDLSRASVTRIALPLYGLAVIIFGSSASPIQGAVGLLAAGMAFLTLVATSNTATQSIVADRIRGRVMATRIMTFTGAYPTGALIQTRLSDLYGPRIVVTTAGVLLLLIGLVVAAVPRLAVHLDDPPDLS